MADGTGEPSSGCQYFLGIDVSTTASACSEGHTEGSVWSETPSRTGPGHHLRITIGTPAEATRRRCDGSPSIRLSMTTLKPTVS